MLTLLKVIFITLFLMLYRTKCSSHKTKFTSLVSTKTNRFQTTVRNISFMFRNLSRNRSMTCFFLIQFLFNNTFFTFSTETHSQRITKTPFYPKSQEDSILSRLNRKIQELESSGRWSGGGRQ